MNQLNLAGSRVLVTGGAGFIGSALVHALNGMGTERIVIADELGTSEKWKNLIPLQFADYLEKDDLLAALEGGRLGKFDLVLHMGACSSTTENDAAYLIRNNFEFTKTLAGLALRDGSRFVYASSAATYGSGEQGMSDADQSPEALNRLRPLNMYGYSKQLFDLWAARQGILDQITGLKYFNVFGPNEDHKGDMKSLVAKAVPQVMETGKLKLFKSYNPAYADGQQERDFLYVKDATAMTLHLASKPSATGLFNIGSGRAATWLQVAEALFSALERPKAIDFIDMPESLRGKYQYHTEADLSRIRGAGYDREPWSLADAILDYVQNYLVKGARLGD